MSDNTASEQTTKKRCKRRGLWVAIIAMLALVGGLSITAIRSTHFQKWYRPPTLALPPDDEVVEVRASLRATSVGNEEVPEFVVPAEHVPKVLDWVRPGEYIRQPWRLDILEELGAVVIRTRDGRELRLRFFDAGKNPAVLTVDGVDQFYGRGGVVDFGGDPHSIAGGITLSGAVREADKASRKATP
jgi:hypothetical protein